MSRRISVGSSFSDSGFVALVILACLGILGGVLIGFLSQNMTLGLSILGIGVLLGLAAIARGVIVARGRQWITPTDEGLIFESNNGEFEFRDDDIVELGTWAKVVYSNGEPKSIQRDGLFILSAGEYRGDLKYSYTYPLQEPDPLAGLLDRNLERLTQGVVQQLARDEPLVGEGWEFDGTELVSTVDRTSEPVPLSAMTAVDVIDDKLNVWVKGEAKPAMLIPAGGVNALILLRHLAKKLEDRGPRTDEDVPGLGRVIFERDHSTSSGVAICCWVFFLAIAAIGVAMIVWNLMQQNGTPGYYIVGGLMAFLGVVIPWAIWANRVNIFRCHTRGVCKITTSATKQLEYKDVREFSYSVVRNYTNGAYTGTNMAISFSPDKDSGLETIDYSASVQRIDAEVDNLREHVSLVIASQMKQRLNTGVDVPWTAGFIFTPEGLDVQVPGGVFSKGKSLLVPYLECAMNMHEGNFYLFRKSDNKQLHSIPVTQPNFFPGHILLCNLAFPEQATALPAPQPEREDDDDPRPESRRERRRNNDDD
jgi:hypothetical protein